MFFVNSKIGEEQSAEDAEDGPPELLVYIGFLMHDEMSYADWAVYLENEAELQILALEDDFKLEVLEVIVISFWHLLKIVNRAK